MSKVFHSHHCIRTIAFAPLHFLPRASVLRTLPVIATEHCTTPPTHPPTVIRPACFVGCHWLRPVPFRYARKFAGAFSAAGYDDLGDIKHCVPDVLTLTAMLRSAGERGVGKEPVFSHYPAVVGNAECSTSHVFMYSQDSLF